MIGSRDMWAPGGGGWKRGHWDLNDLGFWDPAQPFPGSAVQEPSPAWALTPALSDLHDCLTPLCPQHCFNGIQSGLGEK